MRRRPLPETLSAFQLTAPETFQLGDGQMVEGWPPNYAVCRGETVIDLCSPEVFAGRYESADRRTLALDDADRVSIEQVLGLGSTETARHLVTAIGRLARLSIGAIEVPFTPGQWETLAHRAQKQGIPVEALVRRIVDKITAEIFDGRA